LETGILFWSMPGYELEPLASLPFPLARFLVFGQLMKQLFKKGAYAYLEVGSRLNPACGRYWTIKWSIYFVHQPMPCV
jgi:hypothetical protein